MTDLSQIGYLIAVAVLKLTQSNKGMSFEAGPERKAVIRQNQSCICSYNFKKSSK